MARVRNAKGPWGRIALLSLGLCWLFSCASLALVGVMRPAPTGPPGPVVTSIRSFKLPVRPMRRTVRLRPHPWPLGPFASIYVDRPTGPSPVGIPTPFTIHDMPLAGSAPLPVAPWFGLLVFMPLTMWLLSRTGRFAAQDEGESACPRCGYSLVGLSGARTCPECGSVSTP